MTGSLIYQDYIDLYKNRKIICEDLNTDQIQPSSIDLSLSNECYEIKYIFAPKNKVRDKLEDLIIKINLDQKFIFEIDKTYIVN